MRIGARPVRSWRYKTYGTHVRVTIPTFASRAVAPRCGAAVAVVALGSGVAAVGRVLLKRVVPPLPPSPPTAPMPSPSPSPSPEDKLGALQADATLLPVLVCSP
jgi:hypothetical protein